MPRHFIAVALVLIAIELSATALASDPFTLDATSAGSTLTASGASLPDLIDNAYNTKNDFASLAGQSFTARLRYGSITDAATFSRNAAGTSATITVPSEHFTKTFTAANSDDLEKQIRDFFVKNSSEIYSKFLRYVNEQSTLGISDGNPLATTALMADTGFYRFGLAPSYSDDAVAIAPGFRVYGSGGFADTREADGATASLGFAITLLSTDRIGLITANTFRYRDAGGADVYEGVSTWGLPIQIIEPSHPTGLSWQITPTFAAGVGGSWDLAAGGVPIGGQITSSLGYRFGGDWTLVMANQWGYYGGLPVHIGDFESETDVDQQIVKNGVEVIKTFDALILEVGVAYTRFLRAAAVRDYVSPSAGVGLRFSDNSGVRLGYQGDFASNFKVNSGNVLFYVEF
jgi:hypothetical protein